MYIYIYIYIYLYIYIRTIALDKLVVKALMVGYTAKY